MLYKVFLKDDGSKIYQLVAPKQVREIIFHQLHHNKIAGHLGKDRTLAAIRNSFYWPGMTENIKQWCLDCDHCARCKPGPGLGKSSLRQSQYSAPLERLGRDIVGPLPITDQRLSRACIVHLVIKKTKKKQIGLCKNYVLQW